MNLLAVSSSLALIFAASSVVGGARVSRSGNLPRQEATGAERTIPPFAVLDRQVRRQKGGWAGWKPPLATLFNAERARLGTDFQTELLKYVDNDFDKLYWVSVFLTDREYLEGNEPLPQLSLYLKHRALTLIGGRTDRESLGYAVRLRVGAAVLSETLGLHPLAAVYKSEAERMISENAELRQSFPDLTPDERKLYDSIR